VKATALVIELSPQDRAWLNDLATKFFHRMIEMSASLDALKAQVDATSGVAASAVTLIQGIAAQLTDVQAQLAAVGVTNQTLDDLTSSLKASDDALAAAVASNSPTPAPTSPPATP
jgi:ABC-type transporter Mla subunit MlaD